MSSMWSPVAASALNFLSPPLRSCQGRYKVTAIFTSHKRSSPMLVLPRELKQTIEEFVSAGYPYETCGVLLGSTVDKSNQVARVLQLKNVNTERANDRFEMDPDEMFGAQEEARTAGLELVGIWHSHPDHPARPSQTDLDKAWPCWSYIIASVTNCGVADMRSWRLKDEEKVFTEEDIENE
jgi:proteasome lid subunit RPN8/RPN11